MEIFSELNSNYNLSLALGYFDGVHIGHQKVIKSAVNYAHLNNAKSAVITFKDHPCCYFWKVPPKYILSRDDRRNKLAELGVDYLYEIDFGQISTYTADDYMKNIIVKYFSPVAISTGFNHNFGLNKSGNTDYLVNNAGKYNYKYFMIDAEQYNDVVISSTVIRKMLSNGDIVNANSMLGYNFSISGVVIKGEQIGHKIGFPTINICYPQDLIELPYGVYSTIVCIDGKSYYGITNFGIKPTVSNSNCPVLETHIFNFNKDLYNRNVRIEFLYKIRDEIKFSTIDDLKTQIKKDIDFVLSKK